MPDPRTAFPADAEFQELVLAHLTALHAPQPPTPASQDARGIPQESVTAGAVSDRSAAEASTETVPFTQRIPRGLLDLWRARLEGLGAPFGPAIAVAIALALELSDDELDDAIAKQDYRQKKMKARRAAARRR